MKPQYTRHAEQRMIERRVTADEVEWVLAHHHTRYTDRKGNPIYVGLPNGRYVKVVAAKDQDPPLIITVGD